MLHLATREKATGFIKGVEGLKAELKCRPE
jgi:hypothetical protein